jgi:YD repeat-containing protein
MKMFRMCTAGVLLAISPVILVNTALAESYTYDAQGRIASVTTDAGVATYYCYDAAGNRTYVGPTAC